MVSEEMENLRAVSLATRDRERLTWSDQLITQLRVGGVHAVFPMVRGALARVELGLEGVGEDVPQLRSAVDLLNTWRMESAWRNESRAPLERDLSLHERKEFSQNGEDGVLEWIFGAIGITNSYLIEIGSSDGEENCTRKLVESGWNGIWVEADQERAKHAAKVAAGRVTVIDAPAEPATIGRVLVQAGSPLAPDLVVLDIDGNDWWVLAAVLSCLSPRVLVVEYNSTYRPGQWWVEPYRRGGRWDESFRHGASLNAIARLAATCGFALAGCDSTGVNAFYVSRKEAHNLDLPALGEIADLYRAPWFSPGLWGHPRRKSAGIRVPLAEPLCDDELRCVSLAVKRWPTNRTTRVLTAKPIVLEAMITNGTDKILTSEGGTPFHLAWRWRRTGEPALPWNDEPRLRLHPIGPRSRASTRMWTRTPPSAGRHCLECVLVQENVRWLGHQQTALELEIV